jgi:pimeloyl-ACP methyl ester carboxylesterase
MGGLIALSYANKHPKTVQKLILVSVPLSDHRKPLPSSWRYAMQFCITSKYSQEIIDYIENNQQIFKALERVIFPGRKAEQDRTAKTAHDLLKGMPVKALASCFYDLLTIDFRFLVEKLKVPVLYIYGTKDLELGTIDGTALYTTTPSCSVINLPCGIISR